MHERGFSIPGTAQILGVSSRTIKRRLQEFGMTATQRFSVVDDQTIDLIIATTVRDFPSFGYRRMTGALLSRGIRL